MCQFSFKEDAREYDRCVLFPGQPQNVYYYKNDQEHLNETSVRLENNSSEWSKSEKNSIS